MIALFSTKPVMNPNLMATKAGTDRPQPVGTSLLEQLADLDARSMSAETARKLLQITFETSHKQRVKVLSEKARKGILVPAERTELDEFIRVADLLAILHSRARQALKHAGLPV
jgi:hypothetical protein